MVSLLDSCGEGCGWTAAIIAILCWGSFGVPIRSLKKGGGSVEVNFFVMQSYKTFVCFITSWFVILLGEEVRFTPWGIVSGLFWVPGAACGIYGIRNAGLAVAVGTWSSIIVVSSFIFGIVIFQEGVKDIGQTICAFLLLMCGLIGMSRYAEPQVEKADQYQRIAGSEDDLRLVAEEQNPIAFPSGSPQPSKRQISRASDGVVAEPPISANNSTTSVGNDPGARSSASPTKMIPMEIDLTTPSKEKPLLADDSDKEHSKNQRVVLFGGQLSLTRRQLGICGAIVNGAWGGLNLVPLHYAQRDLGLSGAAYLISYGTGSMMVCISIWIGLVLYHFRQKGNLEDALAALPAFHVKEIGLNGLLAGLLYSIGNFCSILAVAYLGQAVGYSACQAQLLISGLWGVFYFKEINGEDTIAKWFASAVVAFVGIIWLSYEHEGGSVHR